MAEPTQADVAAVQANMDGNQPPAQPAQQPAQQPTQPPAQPQSQPTQPSQPEFTPGIGQRTSTPTPPTQPTEPTQATQPTQQPAQQQPQEPQAPQQPSDPFAEIFAAPPQQPQQQQPTEPKPNQQPDKPVEPSQQTAPKQHQQRYQSYEEYMNQAIGNTQPKKIETPDLSKVNPDDPKEVKQFFDNLVETAVEKASQKTERQSAIQNTERRLWDEAFEEYGTLKTNLPIVTGKQRTA